MKIAINGYQLPEHSITFSTFPGGEEYIRIPKSLPTDPKEIEVGALIKSSQDVMRLLMITDALKRYVGSRDCKFYLYLGYLPYARQDRVCAEGESFSLKVFTKLINDLKYDEVHLADCHSEVGVALLDNVHNDSQKLIISHNPTIHNLVNGIDYIIIPDAGAAKKATEVAEYYGKPTIQCLKQRREGKIVVEVLGDVKGKTCVILDDICDGGGTFLALANALAEQEPEELHLFVTHGIFSRGKRILLDHFNTVGASYDWTKD